MLAPSKLRVSDKLPTSHKHRRAREDNGELQCSLRKGGPALPELNGESYRISWAFNVVMEFGNPSSS